MLTCIAYYVLKNHLHVYHKFQYRDKSLWIIFITIFIYTHTYYLSYAHHHKIIITIFTRHIRISFDSQDSMENLRKDFNKFLKTKTNALLQHLNEKRKNITPPPPYEEISRDYTGAWQISAINYASKTRMAINTDLERGGQGRGSRNERIQEQDGGVRATETRATTLLLLLLPLSPQPRLNL